MASNKRNRQRTNNKRPSSNKRPSNNRRPTRPGRRTQPVSKGVIAALVGLGLGIVVLVGVIATSSNTAAAGSTDPAAFDLPAIGDSETRIRLADYRGQPLVVNFFASWCTACDAELPGFATVSRELEGQVAFVGVAALETGDPMFMPERHDITWWPLASDIGGRNGSGLHAALGGRGMPITAFYDAGGNLVHVDGGALPEPALRQRLAQLYGLEV